MMPCMCTVSSEDNLWLPPCNDIFIMLWRSRNNKLISPLALCSTSYVQQLVM